MLRRQKHVLSQSTTPFACTLIPWREGGGGGDTKGEKGEVAKRRGEKGGGGFGLGFSQGSLCFFWFFGHVCPGFSAMPGMKKTL